MTEVNTPVQSQGTPVSTTGPTGPAGGGVGSTPAGPAPGDQGQIQVEEVEVRYIYRKVVNGIELYQGVVWFTGTNMLWFTVSNNGIYGFGASRRMSTEKFLRMWRQRYGTSFPNWWELYTPTWVKFKPVIMRAEKRVLKYTLIKFIDVEFLEKGRLYLPLPGGGSITVWFVGINGWVGFGATEAEARQAFIEEVKEVINEPKGVAEDLKTAYRLIMQGW